MVVLRVALTFAGAFLCLLGAARALWQIVSWSAQVQHGLRPAIYPDGTPRVYIAADCGLSAFGFTLAFAAWRC